MKSADLLKHMFWHLHMFDRSCHFGHQQVAVCPLDGRQLISLSGDLFSNRPEGVVKRCIALDGRVENIGRFRPSNSCCAE